MIYILVPVHNRVKVTENLMECLTRQTYRDIVLIVIDDGSRDHTDLMVKSYFKDAIILYGNGNLWWAGALQVGYDYLKKISLGEDDIVLILNDDVIFEDDYLEKGVNEIKKNPNAMILSQAIAYNDPAVKSAGVSINWQSFNFKSTTNENEIACFSTRGLFVPAKSFINSRGFFPKLLPHYFSDYEFTIRLHRQGLKFVCTETVFIKFFPEYTGMRTLKEGTWKEVFTQLFSKRYVANPMAQLGFIVLSAPWNRKFPLILQILRKNYRIIINSIQR